MPGGILTLTYSDSNSIIQSIEVGCVTTLQESLSKSCTVVPLVSMSVADTFAIDTKTQKTINIQFTREQGRDGMSNAEWLNTMLGHLNRWQCRSDGFRLTYEPDRDNPYIAEINENGYVKSFSYSLKEGINDYVSGSIEFHVGTMYVNSSTSENERTYISDYYIRMTDSDGVVPYTLMSSSINCVESYTLYGGPETPFEYLTMTIPRNRLSSVAPALTAEDGIVAGRNRLDLHAMGDASMTVTKCKLSDNYYTITAYCNADTLRGSMLQYEEVDNPENIIRHILGNTEGNYNVKYTEDEGNLIMDYTTPEDVGYVTLPAGTNVWRALQICAMLLGCRIFFANNCAYVVDYRKADPDHIQEAGDNGVIDLYNVSSDAMATVSTPSLGDEGIDTVVNSLTISATVNATDESGNATAGTQTGSIIVRSEDSIALYNERSTTLNLSELMETSEITDEEGNTVTYAMSQATVFGQNYLDYRDEPQQSIEFTMKEMYNDTENSLGAYWSPQYIPAARAARIIDEEDDVTITNVSKVTGGARPQRLFMSCYERNYPEGTTTYTWGAISTIDLASSTSQINSALGV